MKEQLIKLAKEKGFLLDQNHISCISSWHVIDEYYVWMCELQKWLRDTHHINIVISPERYYIFNEDSLEIEYMIKIYDNQEHLYYNFKTYEEALEKGLFEALKLIK